MDLISGSVNQTSSPQAKITLFRSLFRGRDDVYPRRFESRKTGRSGYAPACANEWVRGVCEKPRIKCAECPNRRFLPVTDDVIRWHLSGCDAEGQPFVAGVYPLLQDETCFFLAVDFDKADWREDAAAFLETCRRLNIPVALERSRSGRGAHAWFFFEEAIPAALARRLGSHVLTETMERRPDVGLDSYDRLFPNQDTMPRGGFGNLIALPLQKGGAQTGQHAYSSIAPCSVDRPVGVSRECSQNWRDAGRTRSSRMLNDAAAFSAYGCHRKTTKNQSRGLRLRHVEERPPIVGDLPATLELVLGNEIYIPKQGLHPGLRNRLLRLAAFQNPEFYKAQAMRLSTYDKPRVIACAEDLPHHIGLPRGCLDDARKTLTELGVRMAIRDERRDGTRLEVKFQGELRPCAKDRSGGHAAPRDWCPGGHYRVWKNGCRCLAHC